MHHTLSGESVASLVLALCLLSACVANEQERYRESKAAYEDCVAQHGRDSAECEAAKQRAASDWRIYEDNARRAWGCDPAQEDCPTPR